MMWIFSRRTQWVSERQNGKLITRVRDRRPLRQHWEEERQRLPPSSPLLAKAIWTVILFSLSALYVYVFT